MVNSVRRARHFLACTFAVLGVAVMAPVSAMDTIKMLVPANPGGGWDQTARSLQQVMQDNRLVKDIQIEHRGGAAGTVGLAHFIASSNGAPDTLMIGGSVMVGGILLHRSPHNLTQLKPIARLTGEYNVLVVSAESPIRSIRHLVKRLKEDPASVTWGGGSAGGTDHLIVGMIGQSLGIDPRRMKYNAYSGGGDAQAAIINGEVTVGLSGWNEFANAIVAGKMRPIAITAEQRLPGLRMPTLKEHGIDVAMANWRGVFAPAGITEQQHRALLSVVDKAVRSDAWREKLVMHQWTDLYLSGRDFAIFLEAEQKRTAQVMRLLGLLGN